ncbi:Neutral/alkaline nonlysosomal ceramidase [Morchella conica CCBAS932]|uniref:Neutral ceramidase n=1 Tax=Morchella conica CCBAS932 TaxID=1392247 RepID=A0A3N4L320_9PEZI|nr:Neutral/alkaline nonlysosomal ceramidase [Morchella conica CCBAS932]
MHLIHHILPLICLLFLQVLSQDEAVGDKYLLGVGRADVTGPVVEIGMMGYADLAQKGSGLRQRIHSRAFIVADVNSPGDRFVYVSVDVQSGDTAIRDGVLKGLEAAFPGVYGQNNVAVVGTHSHAGPGAWLNYLLPQITTQGFGSQSYTAIVEGIVLSIKRAHTSLTPGYLSLAKGLVSDANVNRSPYAYEANPAEERAEYGDVGGDVDKEMTVLSFKKEDGTPLGLLNWFPVHGTSLYGNNTLIAGDNKGYAALQLEKDLGNGFVAGFSQANVGDTSPNTLGPVCQDTGLECRYEDSTCNGVSQQCRGRGPAFQISDTESCRIIGQTQYLGAKRIYNSAQTPVSGDGGIVRSLHTFVDFGAGYEFKLSNGSMWKTCKAALGFSFAAGTTDWPGFADFTQNDPGAPSNPFWLLVRDLLKTPTKEQKDCHAPKPILLNVGEMDQPYAWTPNIVDIQMFRVGQLAIIVAPGEATTMAGRRWKAAVADELDKLGIISKESGWTVIGGPANSYTHYIATPEEYAIQRYEGASTLYGQFTLDAYISLYKTYAPYLAAKVPSTPLPTGTKPPINTNNSISLITGVVQDSPPLGKSFGSVLTDVMGPYQIGAMVKVVFVGANPRNNLRLEGTFAAVEKNESGTWARVRDDTDWNLVYEWKRTEELTGQSKVTITWTVESGTPAGQYRIRYYGDSKALFGGKITAFEGVSGVFNVV